MSLLVVHQGEVILDELVGTAVGGAALSPQTRWLLLSASKPLTAVAIAVLVQHGQLTFDEPLASFFEGFDAPGRRDATLRHLLSHTAGFPDSGFVHVPPAVWSDWKHAVALTTHLPLESVPGEVLAYHGLTYGILGAVVEQVSGTTFSDFFTTEVGRPWGMDTFSWGRPAEQPFTEMGAADQEFTPFAQMLQTDEVNSAVLPAANGWGTACDLAMFYEALRQGGQGVIGPALVQEMVRPHSFPRVHGVESPRGLGFEVGSPQRLGVFGDVSSPRTYGHPGGRALVAWCDPDAELVAVVLGNGAPNPELGERRLGEISRAISNLVLD